MFCFNERKVHVQRCMPYNAKNMIQKDINVVLYSSSSSAASPPALNFAILDAMLA